MLLKYVKDEVMLSGDVQQVASTNAAINAPFLPGPSLDNLVATVFDVTPGGYAAAGQLVASQYTPANFLAASTGATSALNAYGANFLKCTAQQQPLPFGQYGIVRNAANAFMTNTAAPTTAGNPLYNQMTIILHGQCNALCTTGAAAIAPGTFLTADGAGNLSPLVIPTGAPTPVATPYGTTGAGSVSYKLAAVGFNGVQGALGTAGTTSTANASITATNGIVVTWTPVADAAYYVIVRSAGGTNQGIIGVVPAIQGQYIDTGAASTAGSATSAFLAAPTGPTPTVAQVTGAVAGGTTNSYKLTGIGSNGLWSAEGTAGSLTTANANLSQANANKLTWTNSAGAVLYAVDRTVGGVNQGFIGFASPAQSSSGFLDSGLPATAYATMSAVSGTNPGYPELQPGMTLAISLGTLAASTTTPTLVPVYLGGF